MLLWYIFFVAAHASFEMLCLCALALALPSGASSEKGTFAGFGLALLTGLCPVGRANFCKKARWVPPLGGRGHRVHICRTARNFFCGLQNPEPRRRHHHCIYIQLGLFGLEDHVLEESLHTPRAKLICMSGAVTR